MTIFSDIAVFRSDELGRPLQGGRVFAAEAAAIILGRERVEYLGEASDPSFLVIRNQTRYFAVRREVFSDATRD
jgi:hypothetical protein